MAGVSDPWISVTNASHLVLDGVPMKISENFRPKPKLEDLLPRNLRVHHSQSEVLNFHYDYEKENRFMQRLEAEKKEKLELAEKKRIKEENEKIQLEKEIEQLKQEEAREKHQNAIKPTEGLSEAPNEAALKKETVPAATTSEDTKKMVAVVPMVTNAILLPERASPVTVSAADRDSTTSSCVNIKDFENLADDPFDNLELKTINDMQELKSVLANSQAHQAKEEPSATKREASSGEVLSNPSSDKARDSPIYQNPQTLLSEGSDIYSNVSEYQPALPNNFHINKPPVAAPRVNPSSKSHNNLDRPVPVVQYKPESEDVNIVTSSADTSTKSSIIPPPPVKPKPTVGSKPINKPGQEGEGQVIKGPADKKVQSLANALSKNLGVVSRPPGAPKGFSYTGSSTAPTTNGTKPNDGGEKGVKDIEWPSLDLRSPPSTPAVENPPSTYLPPTNSFSSATQSQNPSKHSNDLNKGKSTKPSHPRRNFSGDKSNKDKKPAKARKSSQSSTDGQAVESLLSMGFEKAQIAVAIKHLGSDTKQLAEHLCAVQQLVTQDVKWQSAQQAVFMCGPDLAKAEMFAKGYQQLSEFGFGEEQVKEALISNNMDMQKALDALVS